MLKIAVCFIIITLLDKYLCVNHPQENIVSIRKGQGVGGLWKSKISWKAHWVKQWEIRKIYVPVWKKVWAPIDIKEWIPFPEPPKDLTKEPKTNYYF